MQAQSVTTYPSRGFVFSGEVPEKICVNCNEGWPADSEFFYRESRQPDGLMRTCKACYSERPCMVKLRGRAPK